MNRMDDEIRELLRRKAADVPPHLDVPPSLAPRARRRIVLNAVGAGLMVAVIVVGVLAGARALGFPSDRSIEVGGSRSPSTRPAPSAPAACTAGQLRATATMQGAAGSLEGAISFTNRSPAACTLDGRPVLTLLDGDLSPITSGISFTPSRAGWSVNGSPSPPGWPLVTLGTGDSASVRIRWSNWCPDGRPAPSWRIGVPGGGSVDVTAIDTLAPPPCNGAESSTVEVGPFEPALGP